MLLTQSLFFSLSYAACLSPKLHQKRAPPSKRDPQISSPDDLETNAGPSPISIDLPAEWLPADPIPILPPSPFLPPPWSPSADIDSPYPSSGVSAWDDSGRSQMSDNMPLSTWRSCPAKRLDCSRCPGDQRCRRYPGSSSTSSSSSDIKSESDPNANCPLLQCDTAVPFLHCGKNAKCTRGFCVCDLGFKGSWKNGVGARGTEGLGKITVYQAPGVDCDVKCEALSCGEVGQVDVGECWKTNGEVHDTEEGVAKGELDTDTVKSGAINLPVVDNGVVQKKSADHVLGVADTGSVGEAN